MLEYERNTFLRHDVVEQMLYSKDRPVEYSWVDKPKTLES
jgi:hypothetical protein